jgi:hypothetical protein
MSMTNYRSQICNGVEKILTTLYEIEVCDYFFNANIICPQKKTNKIIQARHFKGQ